MRFKRPATLQKVTLYHNSTIQGHSPTVMYSSLKYYLFILVRVLLQIVQTVLELILLPWPLVRWDHKCMPPYVGSFSCSLILSNNTILNNKFLLELHFKKQPLGNSNSTTKEDERMADGYHFLLIRLAVNNKQCHGSAQQDSFPNQDINFLRVEIVLPGLLPPGYRIKYQAYNRYSICLPEKWN